MTRQYPIASLGRTFALSLVVALGGCSTDLGFEQVAQSESNQNFDQDEAVIITSPGGFERGKLISMHFRGPYSCEDDTGNYLSSNPNPFLHYQCFVTVTPGADSGYTRHVPIFFNASSNPAEIDPVTNEGYKCGYAWEARYRPEITGEHDWQVSCKLGQNLGLVPFGGGSGGQTVQPHGEAGSFTVADSDLPGIFRLTANGYVSDTGDLFIKTGHDSPENFLAYGEFDATEWNGQTYLSRNLPDLPSIPGSKDKLHYYHNHIADYTGQGRTWQAGKGRGILGAIDYIASKGMNSLYLILFNGAVAGYSGHGDGNDIWPHACNPKFDANCLFNFDISKLQQWEFVFRHMTEKRMMLHILFGETEVDQMFGAPADQSLTRQRKVFIKEMIARFGHHPNLIWNAGEEFDVYSNNDDDVKLLRNITDYIASLDWLDHPRGTHTYPHDQHMYDQLVSHPTFTMISLQDNQGYGQNFNSLVNHYRNLAAHPIYIGADEAGPGMPAAKPGQSLSGPHYQLLERFEAGSLWAKADGREFYRGYNNGTSTDIFGYTIGHADIDLEDFSTFHEFDRRAVWLSAYLRSQLPFRYMVANNSKLNISNAYLLERPSLRLFAIYNSNAQDLTIDLPLGRSYDGEFWDAENNVYHPTTICVDGGNDTPITNWPWDNGRNTVLKLQERQSACP